MDINNRFCIQKGHEKFPAFHLCVFKDCQINHRWCCSQCFAQEIHKHDKQDLSHILPWQEIIILKKQEVDDIYQEKQLQQMAHRQCLKLQKFIDDYYSFVQSQILKMNRDKESLQLIISDLTEQNFIKLNNQQICEILFINKKEFIRNFKFLIKPIQNIDEKLSQLETIFQYQYEYWSKYKNDDVKQIKYQIMQIDKTNNNYNASQISNNQQYLAYGGYDQILKIYDIKLDKIIKDIKVYNYISVIQFTFDSSKLYIGCDQGYVQGYEVQNDFKEIFRLQIHQAQVRNMRTIQNMYLITCSGDSIIKTDIKNKKQIFKMVGHKEQINAIEYNSKDDVIISGSNDKSIKLWDCNTQRIIINKENSHQNGVQQIQLINNHQNLLSLDQNNKLYKWRIDLIQNDLVKIQEFTDLNKIFNFYQINQDQNLILICEKYFRVLDNSGETISLIDHKAGNEFYQEESIQLDNGRYIQIRSQSKIFYILGYICLAILQN